MAYITNDRSGNAASGWLQARALSWLKNGESLQSVYQQLYDDGGVPDQTWEQLSNDLDPKAYAFKKNGNLHIFIEASTRASHFNNHNLTWRGEADVETDNGSTFLHAGCAKRILQSLINLGMHTNITNIRITGHSLGGGVATSLGMQMANSGMATPKVHTFGAPKCRRNGLLDVSNKIILTRWFRADDPVVSLPPQRGIAPLVYELLTPSQRVNFASWGQPTGGAMLLANGIILWSETGTNLGLSTISDVASWMYSWTRLSENPHSLSNYIINLNLAQNIQAEGSTTSVFVRPEPIPIEVERPTQEPLLRPDIRKVIENIIVAQQAPPDIINPPTGVLRTYS